ncbi:hypothetical protein CY34DRAFT_813412 [Suillus luteus UH-Slu-Lm8-n1]|uniref:Uncharacterized protein n=1 Tax=Suillus luteus UH-Slu-Lm8-n1 TaxID=930992 RepID=A0A0C9ZWB0_9AGAM|nr:hypothetical protein CY34DRAFT_813412 [Suillus luteus UH-Slu-Lm8-n1]
MTWFRIQLMRSSVVNSWNLPSNKQTEPLLQLWFTHAEDTQSAARRPHRPQHPHLILFGNCGSFDIFVLWTEGFKFPVCSTSLRSSSCHLLTLGIMNTDILALDRQEVVNDLVHRLGSLSLFLDGINDLMKFSQLEDHELQRYSRKIIALTECARTTLRREGIALYLFVTCSEEHLKYKSAYFSLLTCIRRRRPAFSADIGYRIASLLFALESNFVIQCGGVDTRAQLGIEELLVPKNPLAACKSITRSSAQKSHAASDVMLPPATWGNKWQKPQRFKLFEKPEPVKPHHPPVSSNPRGRPFVRSKRFVPDEKQPVSEESSNESWTDSLLGFSSKFEDIDPFMDDFPSLVVTPLDFEF